MKHGSVTLPLLQLAAAVFLSGAEAMPVEKDSGVAKAGPGDGGQMPGHGLPPVDGNVKFERDAPSGLVAGGFGFKRDGCKGPNC
jgi:hypothetical protein